MSTHPTTPSASPELGARLVALAGLGLVGYGVLFLIRNFTGFIELGLALAVPRITRMASPPWGISARFTSTR